MVADGLANPVLSRTAPYDLLIANILAGPLTRLAPEIIRVLAPGAHAGAVGPAHQSGKASDQLLS